MLYKTAGEIDQNTGKIGKVNPTTYNFFFSKGVQIKNVPHHVRRSARKIRNTYKRFNKYGPRNINRKRA